jgi:peptide deformylase
MKMQIVKYPEPSLLQRSSEAEVTKELSAFIDEMFYFMKNNLKWGEPVGLAAPQVGRNIRVFIALDEVYINPILTPIEKSGTERFEEGCYSLEENKFDYPVERYKEIKLRWQDRKSKWHERRFTGFPAQVIQHEYDHLEGRLCNQAQESVI